jgi:hypothetical protein
MVRSADDLGGAVLIFGEAEQLLRLDETQDERRVRGERDLGIINVGERLIDGLDPARMNPVLSSYVT